jgi:hypothetical protein
MRRIGILTLGLTLLCSAGILLAGKPKPGPTMPRTDWPTLVQPTIGPLGPPEPNSGNIRPGPGVTPPPGSCSQITITAWRNEEESNHTLTPHEMVHATGTSLALCQYTISCPRRAWVKLVASTTIPGWKVVAFGESTASGVLLWEEGAFVTWSWTLKPIVLPRK